MLHTVAEIKTPSSVVFINGMVFLPVLKLPFTRSVKAKRLTIISEQLDRSLCSCDSQTWL
jgi:hypothetical protein